MASRAEVADNGFIHFVAAHAHRCATDRVVQRNHRDIGGTATNIHDHVTHGVFHRDAHTDSGSHRFVNQVDFLRTSLLGGIDNGAGFHFGNAARHAHNNAGPDNPQRVLLHALNEGLEECFDQFKIRNHAIAHGAHGTRLARGPAEHLFRFKTNRRHAIVLAVHGNHRRFVNDNALACHVNESVRRTQVDTDITGEESEQNKR